LPDESAVTGYTGSWDGKDFIFSPQLTPGFKAITSIVGMPRFAAVGTPRMLTGKLIPQDAANKTITWNFSPLDNGEAGASIEGDTFTATTTGFAFIRSTIADGLGAGSDSIFDFGIRVLPASALTTPTLTSVEVNRSAFSNATVIFTSDVKGTYYYQLNGIAPTAASLAAAGTNATEMIAGEQTINLAYLTSGEQIVHIAAINVAGQVSNLLTIRIPAYSGDDGGQGCNTGFAIFGTLALLSGIFIRNK